MAVYCHPAYLIYMHHFCHEVMGPDAMILVFWMLSFKPIFSLSSFTFIKMFFSSSLLSAIRVVSSAYLILNEWCKIENVVNLKTGLLGFSLNPYLTYNIMRKSGLEEAQAGTRIAGRNINNLRYTDISVYVYIYIYIYIPT